MLSHGSTGVVVVDAHEDFLPASAITRLPVMRNVALLSAAVAANASTLQLTSAVASISLVRLVDVEGLLGPSPALVLAAGALAAVPAGRAMDRRGRVPVLAAGSPVAVVAGLIGVGIANGPARLIRTAGGDMYPPERQARGIALVLFGGILVPAVFGLALAAAGVAALAIGAIVLVAAPALWILGAENSFRRSRARRLQLLLPAARPPAYGTRRGEGEWWRRHDEYEEDRA